MQEREQQSNERIRGVGEGEWWEKIWESIERNENITQEKKSSLRRSLRIIMLIAEKGKEQFGNIFGDEDWRNLETILSEKDENKLMLAFGSLHQSILEKEKGIKNRLQASGVTAEDLESLQLQVETQESSPSPLISEEPTIPPPTTEEVPMPPIETPPTETPPVQTMAEKSRQPDQKKQLEQPRNLDELLEIYLGSGVLSQETIEKVINESVRPEFQRWEISKEVAIFYNEINEEILKALDDIINEKEFTNLPLEKQKEIAKSYTLLLARRIMAEKIRERFVEKINELINPEEKKKLKLEYKKFMEEYSGLLFSYSDLKRMLEEAIERRTEEAQTAAEAAATEAAAAEAAGGEAVRAAREAEAIPEISIDKINEETKIKFEQLYQEVISKIYKLRKRRKEVIDSLQQIIQNQETNETAKQFADKLRELFNIEEEERLRDILINSFGASGIKELEAVSKILDEIEEALKAAEGSAAGPEGSAAGPERKEERKKLKPHLEKLAKALSTAGAILLTGAFAWSFALLLVLPTWAMAKMTETIEKQGFKFNL